MSEHDPYRDDRNTLVAENERLRHELARLRRRRLFFGARVALGALLVGVNVTAFVALPGLLNARDDGRVYLGAMLAFVVVVLDVLFATRVAFAHPPEEP